MSVSYLADSTRATNVRVQVRSASGTTEYTINQQKAPNSFPNIWHQLEGVPIVFEGTAEQGITIFAQDADGPVAIDAFRLGICDVGNDDLPTTTPTTTQTVGDTTSSAIETTEEGASTTITTTTQVERRRRRRRRSSTTPTTTPTTTPEELDNVERRRRRRRRSSTTPTTTQTAEARRRRRRRSSESTSTTEAVRRRRRRRRTSTIPTTTPTTTAAVRRRRRRRRSSSTSGTLYRINAGAKGYTDGDGNRWKSDDFFSNGDTASFEFSIAQTNDEELFQSERFVTASDSPLRYSFPVTSGTFKVKLYFADVCDCNAKIGDNVMDISAEGERFVKKLDVLSEVGPFVAYRETFKVSVSDGALDLELTSRAGNPWINAIEIESA